MYVISHPYNLLDRRLQALQKELVTAQEQLQDAIKNQEHDLIATQRQKIVDLQSTAQYIRDHPNCITKQKNDGILKAAKQRKISISHLVTHPPQV